MNEQTLPDDELLIEAALKELENRGETNEGESSRPPSIAPPLLPESWRGPTLSSLEQARLPKVSTVCESCPVSLWLASAKELRCYCRMMHTMTWDSADPRPLTHCDGPSLRET